MTEARHKMAFYKDLLNAYVLKTVQKYIYIYIIVHKYVNLLNSCDWSGVEPHNVDLPTAHKQT